MSKMSKELNLLYIHSNETYVEDVEICSCEDISDCESDSVSRELMSLSLIAINLSLMTAPLNFNFFSFLVGGSFQVSNAWVWMSSLGLLHF